MEKAMLESRRAVAAGNWEKEAKSLLQCAGGVRDKLFDKKGRWLPESLPRVKDLCDLVDIAHRVTPGEGQGAGITINVGSLPSDTLLKALIDVLGRAFPDPRSGFVDASPEPLALSEGNKDL